MLATLTPRGYAFQLARSGRLVETRRVNGNVIGAKPVARAAPDGYFCDIHHTHPRIKAAGVERLSLHARYLLPWSSASLMVRVKVRPRPGCAGTVISLFTGSGGSSNSIHVHGMYSMRPVGQESREVAALPERRAW